MSATIRDIAIILIAVETIVLNALLIVLIWQIWRLVRMLRDEVRPILEDARETVGTVKGTAAFMSEEVVAPVIQTTGRLAGLRRSVQVFRSEAQASLETVTWLRGVLRRDSGRSRDEQGNGVGRDGNTVL